MDGGRGGRGRGRESKGQRMRNGGRRVRGGETERALLGRAGRCGAAATQGCLRRREAEGRGGAAGPTGGRRQPAPPLMRWAAAARGPYGQDLLLVFLTTAPPAELLTEPSKELNFTSSKERAGFSLTFYILPF